jgi:TetR/AcrR family transcriptional regulator, transcriptional repressor of bet genes
MPGKRAAVEQRRAQILEAAERQALRGGLERLTVREIAIGAGLSNGMVHFHFRNKEDLLLALLDVMLESTLVVRVPGARSGSPAELLAALLRSELARMAGDGTRLRLFFEFWLLGTRNRQIRRRMRDQLDRYREAFQPLAEEVVEDRPDAFRGVRAVGLAHACAGFIKAAAVQSIIDPGSFDVDEYVAASAGLMTLLAADVRPGARG